MRRMTRRALLLTGVTAAGGAVVCAAGGGVALHRINRVADLDATRLAGLYQGKATPLLKYFPGLRGKLPWRPIGSFPTPVEALHHPSPARGGQLFVKRDDLTSARYGGNKLRKLEHLLAEAELLGADTLLTIGGIGSNQALATALHGGDLGFDVALSLFDHPLSPQVLHNLRGSLHAGARITHAPGIARCLWNARNLQSALARNGRQPYFIMAGGSTRLGNVGYVSAALELAEQVYAGELPEPDRIFVAAGSCGTAAGLLVGLRLAGLRSRLTAVQTADAPVSSGTVVRAYAADCARYLAGLGAGVPRVSVGSDDFDMLGEHLGDGYAAPTEAALAAVQWAAPRLTLETTYTGKALAACLDYCRDAGRTETVLFWNTFNSSAFPKADDTDALPQSLRETLARG